MTGETPAIRRVSELMEAQRDALLTGDLTALARLADDLDRALHALARSEPPAAQLARLRATATRNAQMITAARRGVAQVRTLLHPAAPVALTTYGADGRQQSTAAQPGTLLGRR
jgi:hypothetical protein